MEFRETLLAAQRNQQQQSSTNAYYKAKFDPPKKEQKQRDRLSANIQKFLAKKDEEERQKKLEAQRKRDELIAMRDPKALRKIQKTLKVIKSANKSVLEDAVDRDNTAVTREGPDQPDQDDYGYESQEAAALYAKMMQKYSKIPDEPKFTACSKVVKKDLNGTRERVRNALQHEDDPVPHKRRRRGGIGDNDASSPSTYESEKEKKREDGSKSERPKIRKPAPPPMDFNQLLKLAEQKKSEPIDVNAKKVTAEQDTERPMTKKQRKEYEEEMARRQRRQERLEAEKGGKKAVKEDKPVEKERKTDSASTGRIPKLSDKTVPNNKMSIPKITDRQGGDKDRSLKEKDRARLEKEKMERERERLDKERLDRLKAERERIDRDIDRLNKDRERLDKTKVQLESGIQGDKSNKSVDRSKLVSKEQSGGPDMKKKIEFKSQNTYRIDKTSIDKKVVTGNTSNGKYPSHTSNGKYSSNTSNGKYSTNTSNGKIPNNTINGKYPTTTSNGKYPTNTSNGKYSNNTSNEKYLNGDVSQSKSVPKLGKDTLHLKNSLKEKEVQNKQNSISVNGSLKANGKIDSKKPVEGLKGVPPKKPDERNALNKSNGGPNKPKTAGGFDFDKHINSIGKDNRKFPPGDVRRKPHPDDMRRKPKRRLDSDSEYDSEMDDFIDDGDENMDYSRHIKEIFGYDKSKYRDMDDDDDPTMESSFARQQREEYISKKIGIMEDLEDMKMEAMEKKKAKKKRRISDD